MQKKTSAKDQKIKSKKIPMPPLARSSPSASPPRPRRLAAARPLLLALLLLFSASSFGLFSPVAALTREQAEQTDWHRRGIGSVTGAFFVDRSSSSISGSGFGASSSASDSILVAAADEGAIALLEASSGEIVWRKVRGGPRRQT